MKVSDLVKLMDGSQVVQLIGCDRQYGVEQKRNRLICCELHDAIYGFNASFHKPKEMEWL